MGFQKANVEQDLAFIRQTMEKATTYDNLAPLGYVAIGCVALAGVSATEWILGNRQFSALDTAPITDLLPFCALWLGVLTAALLSMWVAVSIRSRRLKVAPWNGLASRMFLSQIPTSLTAGALTVSLCFIGHVTLIPAVWLLHYGLIAFSFSYFTGKDHGINALVFLLLGIGALIVPMTLRLPLLALGFGGCHLCFGIYRAVRKL
jgi:hypothetical protein